MMVEILCGVLSGANYAQNIRTWDQTVGFANLVSHWIAPHAGSKIPILSSNHNGNVRKNGTADMHITVYWCTLVCSLSVYVKGF